MQVTRCTRLNAALEGHKDEPIPPKMYILSQENCTGEFVPLDAAGTVRPNAPRKSVNASYVKMAISAVSRK